MTNRSPMAGKQLAAPYPIRPCPPVDARPRTSLDDLPAEAAKWLLAAMGKGCHVAPVAELVNTNHAFVVSCGSARFFLKVIRRADAADRLRRELATLRCLDGLPCPELVKGEVLHDRLAVLLTTWLDALPIRYLDFHGTLAPDYLGELGAILSRIHCRLRGAQIPDLQRPPEPELSAAKLELPAHTLLGNARARLFLRLWEEAAVWLRNTIWQPIHGDLQDKNILLGRPGRLFICDFEAVRYGPLACELSVDRIYLKRDLPEKGRAVLQRLLLEGYGNDPGLDSAGAARIRLLRLGELLIWRFGRHELEEEAVHLCETFESLAGQL
jgi:Ser/Thr protein kinase RdoA (MazF antagonist)